MSKKLIYIAGPITLGPIEENVRKPIEIADGIIERGHGVIVPQLTIFWQFISPHTWQEWIDMDDVIIRKCDALYRMPGESKGADHEVELAREIRIPVFTNEDALHEWLDRADSSQEPMTPAYYHGGKL